MGCSRPTSTRVAGAPSAPPERMGNFKIVPGESGSLSSPLVAATSEPLTRTRPSSRRMPARTVVRLTSGASRRITQPSSVSRPSCAMRRWAPMYRASVGDDGQPARRLDAGRQDSQRPGGFETQDSSRALLRDEEPAAAVEGEAGGAIEPGSRTAQPATRGQSIDDAGPAVRDVKGAVRGYGDADQLVAPLEDGLDGRERGDRLVGARRRRAQLEHREDQEDGRARRPA